MYPYFIKNSILYFLYCISLLYSSNLEYGFTKISTTAALFAFPLIFTFLKSIDYKLTDKQLLKLFIAFISSVLLFLTITFIKFYNLPDYTLKSTIIHYSNLVNINLGLYNIHAIYLSMAIGIAILLLLTIYFQLTAKKYKLLLIIIFLYLSVFLIILERRLPTFSLFFTLLLFIFHYFKKIKYFIGSLFVLAIMFMAYNTALPKYQNQNRYADIVKNIAENDTLSSISIRKNIYKITIESFKESPLIGYGIGDVQDVLNKKYLKLGNHYYKKQYNPHNQYITILLYVGIIGFFVAFVFFFQKIYYSFKYNFLCFLFYTFFFINFLSESLLDREIGVIMFAFFESLLLFKGTSKNWFSNENL